MYSDLFRGLGLKNQNLAKYNSPLVSFDGRAVIPQGQISLPVSMEGKEVIMTFIVVNLFSLYTAILGRPWIHAMGAIPSTLHMKVKFCIERGIATVRGNPIPPPLGIIKVIRAVPRSTNTAGTRVSTMASTGDFLEDQPPTKRTKGRLEPIAFDDEDLEGTIQPHNDALGIAAWISGFLVKMVMID